MKYNKVKIFKTNIFYKKNMKMKYTMRKCKNEKLQERKTLRMTTCKNEEFQK